MSGGFWVWGLCGGCGLLEQPSLCFSAGNMSSHKGLNGTCSVHEYSGTFAGQPVRFKMTSVCGHVMTLDFLGEPPAPCPTPIPLREARQSAAPSLDGAREGSRQTN